MTTTRPVQFDRRHLLRLASGTGALLLVGCAAESSSTASTAPAGTDAATTSTGATPTTGVGTTAAIDETCSVIPEETAGPFPGDGSNGVNVLTEDGVVRADIRSSVGSASGTAEGVALTVELKVVDTAGCAPMPGAGVYLWHADSEGRYSMYSSGVTDQNYLRGVQAADANGVVRFTTVYPGCYDGRWPHIHFEVYPSVDDALATSNLLRTSQLAFPKDACDVAYQSDGYASSVSNLARTSLSSDNVFGDDGAVHQLATVTGDPATGFTATLTVAV